MLISNQLYNTILQVRAYRKVGSQYCKLGFHATYLAVLADIAGQGEHADMIEYYQPTRQQCVAVVVAEPTTPKVWDTTAL